MKRFTPLASKIMSRILGHPAMAQAASRTEMLAPEEIIPIPPVKMDDSQREKVTRTEERTSFAAEWAKIDGRPDARHQPTMRYEFEHVLATPDGFFSSTFGYNAWGRLDLAPLMKSRIAEVDHGFHGLRAIGTRYFGHWLMDCLPTTRLRRPGEALFFPTPKTWPHALSYHELFGLDPLEHDYVYFDRLTFCDDIGKNSHLGARLLDMRREVQQASGNDRRRLVYFRRGDTGIARTITNEDALSDALAARGFEIVDARADLDVILRACSKAEMIVSMEGSHFANCILPADTDTRFVIINPADRFCNIWSDYLGLLGGRMGTVVAEKAGDGYRVDIPHLLDFADRMMQG